MTEEEKKQFPCYNCTAKEPGNPDFCEFAWVDIYKYIFALTFKGNFSEWMKEPNIVITCCTDGIRPVFYKIERVE